MPFAAAHLLVARRYALAGLLVLVASSSARRARRRPRASLATCDDLAKGQWSVRDLRTTSLGQWEPSYDVPLWQRDRTLHLFVQRAEQVDAEGVGALPP